MPVNRPFRADFHDPTGLLGIEYDRRIGYFSMHADHLHDHYELYYLLSGERIYFIKDRSYRVMAGDLVLVDRNVVHKTLDSGRPDHDRVVLYLKPELFAGMGVPADLAAGLMQLFRGSPPVLRFPSRIHAQVERLAVEIVDEMVDPQPGSELLLRHRTVELLLCAWRYRHLAVADAEDAEPVLHPKTQAVVHYLNENFRESQSLTGVADMFRISPHYLSRLFRHTTGFSFSDYLNLLRIKEAQRLLRETDDPITDIALRSGFGNFSHFGKMFKRMVNASPRQYRQQHTKQDRRQS